MLLFNLKHNHYVEESDISFYGKFCREILSQIVWYLSVANFTKADEPNI